ncbi:MAG: hypothetical protein AM326_04500 [Candidatus Thorarchaeota archaeon SMTZ-45]|nr:MAG: hypothetical protein AM326_04500 [Candidatus Thorarchaeota archaeon SMTZ-45]
MILEDWVSILEACVVPDPVVALPNVLKIPIYSTDLAFYFQVHTPLEEGTLGSMARIKGPSKNGP